MLWHLIAGALVGVFVLQPVNDLIFYLQHDEVIRLEPEASNAAGYVGRKLKDSLIGAEWRKGLFYAAVGAAAEEAKGLALGV